MVTIGGRKLFEEIDRPTRMKIISENSKSIELEAEWTGELKGFNGFPDGKKVGSGTSVQSKNGVTLSHWEGIFTTSDGLELSFIGRDMSKNNKFVVLRTYFTNSDNLNWLNGLMWILEGEFTPKPTNSKVLAMNG